MCVIFVVQTERPTDQEIEAAFDANNAGAGIAWREGNRVRWEKGLDLQGILDLNRTVPMPYVEHFRIPTCGGRLQALTHPFPLEKDVPLDLKGSSPAGILCHNGHWGSWKEYLYQAMQRDPRFRVPTGPWSDSRAIAKVVAHYQLGFLSLLDEKVVVLKPNHLEFFGSGWDFYDHRFMTSNTSWVRELRRFPLGGTRHHGVDQRLPQQYRGGVVNAAISGTESDAGQKPKTMADISPIVPPGGEDAGVPFNLEHRLMLLERALKAGRISKNAYKKHKKELHRKKEQLNALAKKAKASEAADIVQEMLEQQREQLLTSHPTLH